MTSTDQSITALHKDVYQSSYYIYCIMQNVMSVARPTMLYIQQPNFSVLFLQIINSQFKKKIKTKMVLHDYLSEIRHGSSNFSQ